MKAIRVFLWSVVLSAGGLAIQAAEKPDKDGQSLRDAWLNAARGRAPAVTNGEERIRLEIVAATKHWMEVCQRRDEAGAEKALSEDFVVRSFGGESQTRAKTIDGLKLSQMDWVSTQDLRVRADENFPVATFLSLVKVRTGMEEITIEIFTSLQFRKSTKAERERGCERWLITSSMNMPVHQMLPAYWQREKSKKAPQ